MRRVRMALGLASLCAFLLIAVVPASAHQFTASRLTPCTEEKPCPTKGVGVESEGLEAERNQKFVFGPFTILCTAAAHAKTPAEGAVTWETHSTFSTLVKLNKCLTQAHFGNFTGGVKTSFNFNQETKKFEYLKIVYHVNGFAEIGTGETFTEVEINPGTANFNISGKICKIDWPAQTVPAGAVKKPEGEFSSAVYSTNLVEVPESPNNAKKFPSGFQERLVIDNAFKGMQWEFVEGQCLGEGGFEEAAKSEAGKTGQYHGALEEQLIGGNLGFE